MIPPLGRPLFAGRVEFQVSKHGGAGTGKVLERDAKDIVQAVTLRNKNLKLYEALLKSIPPVIEVEQHNDKVIMRYPSENSLEPFWFLLGRLLNKLYQREVDFQVQD